MTSLAIRRPRPPQILASVAFVLLCLAASGASAQSGGGIRGHFQRFYGQDFYDGQHPGTLYRIASHRQYNGGLYGPAMIYGRQYADEYGYVTAPPFHPARNYPKTGYGGLSY